MKKLLFLAFALVLGAAAKSQGFPINQTIGSNTTTTLGRGILAVDSAFRYKHSFADTAIANLGNIKNQPGAVIRVGTRFFVRNEAATAWVEFGGVSPTPGLDAVLAAGPKSARAATVGELNTNYIQADTTSNTPYEIVVFPDIQNMIRLFQPYSRSMFKWVADSANYYNIKGLLQVGDVTDYNTTAEWDTVMSQLSLVTTAHPTLPYLFVAGNHDYGNGFNPAGRDATRFNTYLGPSHFSGKSFYGGNYNGSNENYWIKFEAGTKKYMALGLEFLPRDAVVTWASNLLDSIYSAEPDREVMVVTHAYISQIGELATDTSYYSGNTYGMSADNSGLELWEKLIRKKPNIRWVFSGHYIIPAAWAQKGLTERVIKVNDYGQIVNQIFVNYQDDLNWGDGYFMRLQFKPNEGLVNVKFWSPYFNQFDSRVPEYALSDPSVTVTNSLGVQRDISVGRDVRIAGDLKVENLTPFRLVRSDSDHVVRDAVNLVYDYDGFKVKALKDSFAIRLTLGDSAKVRTPYIQGQLSNGTKTFQLRSFEPTSLYMGDSSGASAVLPSAAGMTARNTAFGYMSLARTTTGAINTAFGHLTLASNINGNFNNAFGDYALASLTVGSDNTAIGQASMYGATNAGNNTALGTNSLQFITGNENTAIGKGAMGNSSTGSNNTALGRSAGRDISGSNNLFLGWYAGYNAGSVSNRLYIDNNGTDGLPALLYGEFDNQLLRINGQGNFTGKLLVNSSGTADSALQVSGGVYGTAGARFPNLPSGKQAKQVFIDGNGTLYQADSTGTGGSGSMVYPGAGIAVSTGSAWGTSITDNSADWNTVTSKQNISDTSTVDATRWWVQQQGYLTSAPTPTWQQALTAGSTLTGNNTITGGGFNWTWNNAGNHTINLAASKYFLINGGDSYVDFTVGNSASVVSDQFLQGTGSQYFVQHQLSSFSTGSRLFGYAGSSIGNRSYGYDINQDSVELFATYPNFYRSAFIMKDTITLRPHLGNLRIDSLRTVVSTIGKKLVLHDTITGMVERIDPTALADGGVTTVGAFSGSSQANGATISGSTITFGPADGTNPGMVSTGSQTWAGDKTYTGDIIGRGGFTSGGDFGLRVGNAVIGKDDGGGQLQLRGSGSSGIGFFAGGVAQGTIGGGSSRVDFHSYGNGYIFTYGGGTTELIRMLPSFVYNESGADLDFRIEGDTDPNLGFFDASTDRFGVGTNLPQGKLHVSGTNAKIIAEYPGNQFVNLFAGASVSLFSFKDKFGIQTATTLTDDGSANYAQMVFSSKNTIFGDMLFNQTDDYSSRVAILTATAARKGLVVRGASSQSANLFEAQNNSGTILASIDKDGRISAGGSLKTDSTLIITPTLVEPTGTNGQVYYNQTSNKLRGYINGNWSNITTDAVANLNTVIIVDKTNPNATDTRTGLSPYSSERPFLTFAAAWSASGGADVIRVFGGAYNESVNIGGASTYRTIELYNSSIRRLNTVNNTMNLIVRGYGLTSITGIDSITRQFNQDLTLIAQNVYLKTVTAANTQSVYDGVLINGSSSLWAGTFYNVTVDMNRSYLYDTYSLQGIGFTFYNSVIRNTGGGFVNPTGGFTSGGSPEYRFYECRIDVAGDFLASRGTPVFVVNNSEVKYTGVFLKNDNGGTGGMGIYVQNSKLINTNTGATMFSGLVAADKLHYFNNVRNTTVAMGVTSPTENYVVNDISSYVDSYFPGKIGIGVAPSSDNLHVAGAIRSGVAGTVGGSVKIDGVTSGTITIQSQAAAGTYTMTLPNSNVSGYLKNDGSGNLSWDNPAGAGTVTSVATNNGTGITGGTITASGTLAIDTANTISTRAQLQHRIDSLAGTISGGTPGGSTKQFQYNNAGAFAGTAMLTQETNQILVTGAATGTTPFVVNGFEGSTVDIIRAEASGVKRFGVHYDGYVQMMDVTAPGTPAAGYGNLYVTTDSLRFKNDAGVEFTLGRGGSGGVADPGANGIMVRTALNTTTARTLTGTADRITVSNGDGTAGNPTVDIAATYAGQNTIATVGTITSGTWNGSAIGDAYISSAATWNAKQAAYANLTSIGSLANAAGWLYNNGSGTFSYSTPTKSDVGLGNVENTALSTWAGSANITTVGTIGTGTWQGGVIGSTYGGTGVNNGGRTLTINTNSGTIAFGAASKTMTVNNSITLAGTDATTMTFPSTSQDVVGATATQTLTNKRVTSRTGTTASTASLTIDSDATDMYTVTALAAAMTINNPSGTPTDGQKLIIRIKDNGTARSLNWSGSQFRAGDIAFPTTTVLGKTMYIGIVWNAADTKWDLLAYIDNL